MSKTVERQTFHTSRLLDFCSEKELVAQTGHDVEEWPLVILKELADNALDACEEAGVPPEIAVKVEDGRISVSDNGPGIPPSTVDGVLDYSVRVSSREAYVAPDRGAQGNALKTILAMPFVLHGELGRVDISARGQRHEVRFAVNRIRQEPMVTREMVAADQQEGTTITVHWPALCLDTLEDCRERFLQIAADYAFLNPHLRLTLEWGRDRSEFTPTDPGWSKWRPSDPTSPHWYGPDEFKRLIGAYLAHNADHGRDWLVRDFVAGLRGLTGSAKQKKILDATGLARTKLTALMNGHDDLNHELVEKLLSTAKANTTPVRPTKLGVIGEVHLKTRFAGLGCDMETFDYRKITDSEDGVPAVIETAFAWRGDDCEDERRLVTGVNWSPGIGNPFRELGGGYRDGLTALLEKQRAGADEPVVFLLHLACPRVRYTDRGKSAIAID
jgi:DNA topoisomerase VI subunit B